MVYFRQKNYGSTPSSLFEFLKTPSGAISATALGVSTANMSSNIVRHNTDKKYQTNQLNAIRNLSRSLDAVDTSINRYAAAKDILEGSYATNKDLDKLLKTLYDSRGGRRKGKKKKLFSRNDFIGNVFTGSGLGASIGAAVGKFLPNKVTTTCAIGVGTLVGASLGLVYSIIKDISSKLNIASTVDNRLMRGIIEQLKGIGLVEGKDFTRDPKKATELRTKVSIVVSRDSGDLSLIINAVSDDRLKKTLDSIINLLKKSSGVSIKNNEKLSDRYNDITITTVESPTNAKLIAEIIKGLVKEGYPVYILEVG